MPSTSVLASENATKVAIHSTNVSFSLRPQTWKTDIKIAFSQPTGIKINQFIFVFHVTYCNNNTFINANGWFPTAYSALHHILVESKIVNFDELTRWKE